MLAKARRNEASKAFAIALGCDKEEKIRLIASNTKTTATDTGWIMRRPASPKQETIYICRKKCPFFDKSKPGIDLQQLETNNKG
jgi:hypothetical protein